ncbi:MAG TPA: ABC transporter ATP-binding protein [Cellulomonas sp.]
MLHVEGLVKAYGDHLVLDGVDLDVARGQVLGLVGANGAGKTTLISIVAGLRRPDAGTVHVAGVDAVAHRAAAARHVGLAPQELGIYPTLTARANLRTFAELAGLRPRAAKVRAEEVAELLGLAHCLDQRADTLSGGQKRRLHTGMAVLHRPDLLFLDEPTVGADVQSRAGILDLVRDMAAAGTAVVYTTHYLTELEQLEADIAVLDAGRIVAAAPVRELVERWGTESVRVSPKSLESAYLALTGRSTDKEPDDVVLA